MRHHYFVSAWSLLFIYRSTSIVPSPLIELDQMTSITLILVRFTVSALLINFKVVPLPCSYGSLIDL